MSEAALPLGRAAAGGGERPPLVFANVAWRNLWRRRLRTWLSVGGVAFAVLLVSSVMCLQAGIYGGWVDTAARLMNGHLQFQHADYLDDPRVGHAIPGGGDLLRRVERAPGVTGATPRVEAFALVSVGERSYGALAMGVDPEREAALFSLPQSLVEGEYLPRADSAFVGSSLAVNLGVELGAEIVVLGSSRGGGVAALALVVDGIFETGQAELDRGLVQAPLAAVQEAFALGGDVHRVAVATQDVSRVEEYAPALQALIPEGARLRDWKALMPDLEQTIELDRAVGDMMYALLLIVVALSLANAFTMTVFERTREFGMLLAIGMRPGGIVGMLAVEAVCTWALGAALGIALCVAVVAPLAVVGIAVPGLEEIAEMSANTMMPERLHPALSMGALATAPVAMLAGTLAGALLPALRVFRMRPVDALREEE